MNPPTICLWMRDALEADVLARAFDGDGGLRVVVARERSRLLQDAAGSVLLVFDVREDGVAEQLRGLARANPRLRILALSRDGRDPLELIEQGSTNVLGPDAGIDDVRQHVAALAHGEVHLEPALAERVVRRLHELVRLCEDRGVDFLRCSSLSPREREVADLMGRGWTNGNVAKRLGISAGTVKSHVHNILRKLDVESRSEAGAYWRLYQERQRSS